MFCSKCNNEISNKGFANHSKNCNGKGPKFRNSRYIKLSNCPYCLISLDNFRNRGSHVAWCDQNPKRCTYNKDASHMRTPESILKRNIGIERAHANGAYDDANKNKVGKPGTPHTENSKQKIREKALASSHRRLMKSTRNYTKKDGSIIRLDSSWEEVLAKRLDELNVTWERPSPVKWVDNNGVYHNYFPDFYLNDYNMYLDPKGPYALISQQDKIACLKLQIQNLIIITTLDECKNFRLT